MVLAVHDEIVSQRSQHSKPFYLGTRDKKPVNLTQPTNLYFIYIGRLGNNSELGLRF